MNNLFSFLIGILFGMGLTISRMINPTKIQNFLDVTGTWDASLLLVMLSAVFVTFIGYRLISKKSKPFYAEKFLLPTKRDIDWRLISGAILFGIGWGLGGYCPGPSITALGRGVMDPVYFVIAMIIGSWVYSLFLTVHKTIFRS